MQGFWIGLANSSGRHVEMNRSAPALAARERQRHCGKDVHAGILAHPRTALGRSKTEFIGEFLGDDFGKGVFGSKPVDKECLSYIFPSKQHDPDVVAFRD